MIKRFPFIFPVSYRYMHRVMTFARHFQAAQGSMLELDLF